MIPRRPSPDWLLPLVTCALLSAVLPTALFGEPRPVADRSPVAQPDFAKDIYPILKRNCLACHNTTKAKADLNLETPELMLQGGDTGPSIEPGNADASLLFTTAAHIEEPTMPPAKNKSNAENLSPEELAILRQWINDGAKGGAVAEAAPKQWRALTGPHPVYRTAIDERGRFAAAARGQQIHLYDLERKRLVASLEDPEIVGPEKLPKGTAHRDLVQSLAFSARGDLASGGFRTVKLWRRQPPTAGAPLDLPQAPTHAALSPSGDHLALGAADGTVSWLDPTADEPKPVTEKWPGGPLRSLSWRPGGEAAIAGVSEQKKLHYRPLKEGAKLKTLDLSEPASSVAFVDKGQTLAVGHDSGVIRLYPLTHFDPPKAAPKPAPNPQAKPAAPPAPQPKEEKPAPPEQAATEAKPEAKPADTKPAEPAPNPPPPPAPKHPAPREIKGEARKLVALLNLDAEGSRILAIHDNGICVLRQVADGKEERRIQHGGDIHGAALSPDRQHLVTLAKAGPARLWKLADGTKLADLGLSSERQSGIEAAQRDSAIQDALIKHHKAAAEAAAKQAAEEAEKALKAGEAVAAQRTELDAKQRELDLKRRAIPAATAEDITKAREERDAVQRKLTSEGRNLELAARLRAKAVDLESRSLARQKAAELRKAELAKRIDEAKKAIEEAGKDTITAASFAPGQDTLFLLRQSGQVETWTAATGRWLESPAKLEQATTLLALPDERVLVPGKDKKLATWNLSRPWELVARYGDGDSPEPFAGRVHALRFDPSGNRLAAGSGLPSREGSWSLWDIDFGRQLLAKPEAHTDTVTAIAFSPDGKQLATGATDNMVRTWDLDSGDPVFTYEGHSGHVLGVAWSDDGLLLASGSADRQVKIWDLVANEQKQKIEGFGKEVTAVDYLPGGTRLLAASGDNSVKLDNRPLAGASGFVHSAQVSGDGKRIVAGSDEGALRVWNVSDSKLIQAFEAPKEEQVAATLSKR